MGGGNNENTTTMQRRGAGGRIVNGGAVAYELRGVYPMSKILLEVCNDWQIERAGILERNPDLRRIVSECDALIERAVCSARHIAQSVEWDTREAAKKVAEIEARAKQESNDGNT